MTTKLADRGSSQAVGVVTDVGNDILYGVDVETILRWVDRAVIESSFDAMKRRESVFDHATALLLERGVRPQSFLRSGTSGTGATELNEAQAREIRERSSTGRPPAIRGLAAFLQ